MVMQFANKDTIIISTFSLTLVVNQISTMATRAKKEKYSKLDIFRDIKLKCGVVVAKTNAQ